MGQILRGEGVMDILHDVCERLVRAGVPKDVVEPLTSELYEQVDAILKKSSKQSTTQG